MFETTLTKAIRKSQSASETDLIYIAKDNEIAHEALNEICKALISRIESIEKTISETPTPLTVRYRPEGHDYLTLKENLDLIYERLNNLEQN